jgi:D-glycero-alpha-D-manno-heptose-7-phosphate kinase
MLDNLHFIKNLGRQTRDALIGEDLRSFAELMNVHWNYKKQRSPGMSNDQIDEAYALGLKNGALGGKLVGAGGGGFLMFYADNSKKLRSAMEKLNYQEIRFKFDFEGTKVILQ